MTIDVRRWTPPTPAEVKAALPGHLTQVELAARLGVSERRVRYWVQQATTPYRITYIEWLALQTLKANES